MLQYRKFPKILRQLDVNEGKIILSWYPAIPSPILCCLQNSPACTGLVHRETAYMASKIAQLDFGEGIDPGRIFFQNSSIVKKMKTILC